MAEADGHTMIGRARKRREEATLNLNSILIGSEDPESLREYYAKLFGEPAFDGDGFSSWRIGTGWLSVGPHDQVKGKNAHPGRILWNIETPDVKAEFERLKAAGATVVREPYELSGPPEAASDMPQSVSIATFSDPDDNYFQLMSPMS
jgi:predicted enzyme related to lactoylglutathione lyase